MKKAMIILIIIVKSIMENCFSIVINWKTKNC